MLLGLLDILFLLDGLYGCLSKWIRILTSVLRSALRYTTQLTLIRTL